MLQFLHTEGAMIDGGYLMVHIPGLSVGVGTFYILLHDIFKTMFPYTFRIFNHEKFHTVEICTTTRI